MVEKLPFIEDDLISISSSVTNISGLVSELSQPTYSQNDNGKIIIDKIPNGAKSPNKADSVMIVFAPEPPKRRSFFDV